MRFFSSPYYFRSWQTTRFEKPNLLNYRRCSELLGLRKNRPFPRKVLRAPTLARILLPRTILRSVVWRDSSLRAISKPQTTTPTRHLRPTTTRPARRPSRSKRGRPRCTSPQGTRSRSRLGGGRREDVPDHVPLAPCSERYLRYAPPPLPSGSPRVRVRVRRRCSFPFVVYIYTYTVSMCTTVD
jgi:hypothetical protein